MVDSNFTCACGHTRLEHTYPTDNLPVVTYCYKCSYDVTGLLCPIFKADNLKYLERLDADRNR